jgi:hypothetical protein
MVIKQQLKAQDQSAKRDSGSVICEIICFSKLRAARGLSRDDRRKINTALVYARLQSADYTSKKSAATLARGRDKMFSAEGGSPSESWSTRVDAWMLKKAKR